MSDSADMYIHLEEYSSNTAQMSRLKFRKSASDTLGTKVETIDAEYLGQINFEGTNSSSSFHLGASIYAKQSGASGVSKVPTDLYFFTSTDTTDNEWFIIRSDGDIEVTNGTSIEFYNVADGEHGEIYRDDDYLILDPGAGGLLKLVGDIHLDNDADIYFGDENMFDRLRKPTEQYIETWWLLTMDADLWSQTDAPSSSWTIQKDFTPPILAVQGWIACADDISDGESGSFELTYRDWEVFPDQLGDEWMQKTLNLEWEALFDTIANVNDTKFFMGFCVDPDSDRASNEILGFIFDTIGGDLEALSDSGGTETTSGVIGITPNQKNLFKIKITEGHAYFYVNGTQEADLTTNLPEKLMHPIFRGDATGGNAFFAYGKIRIWWSDE